jgi:hypothetical protein
MRLRPLNQLKKEKPVSFLTKKFFNDHEEVMHHFSPLEQLQLTEHFIQMMDCLSGFASEIDNKNAAIFADEYMASVDRLLIEFGSRFKPYTEKEFIQYFLLPIILITKEYYDKEEIKRKEHEPLTVDEAKAFAFICKSQLQQNRVDLLTNDVLKATNSRTTANVAPIAFDKPIVHPNTEIDDSLLLLIQGHLSPFKISFNNEADYNLSVNAIAQFLNSGQAYCGPVVFVKGGVIKKLAFALGEIWRSSSNEIISIEYLLLYTQLFSNFSKIEIDKSNLFSNNLYKYSISKT